MVPARGPAGRSHPLPWLFEIAGTLTPCSRLARQRDPALEGTLSGHLLLDEWGQVTAAVLGGGPRAAEVARCLQGVLLGRALGDEGFSNLRLSQVPLTVHLQRSGLRRPQDVKHPPPGALAAPPPGVCLLRPRNLERDTLPPQELWVDDYDEALAEEEARQDSRVERARWEAKEKEGPRPEEARPLERPGRRSAPQEVLDGVSFDWPLFLRHLSRCLGYNVGAYRDCYLAEARAGIPPSPRVLSVSFDSTGYVHDARDQRDPPDALSRCLEAAVREVWVSEPLHPVSVTLRLGPSDLAMALFASATGPAPPRASVAEVDRLAEAALAAGDGPRAAARFASLLREVPGHPQRCQWHVWRLSAAELRAPWGGEPFQEALEAFRRELSAPGVPGHVACLGRAAPLIARLLGEDRDGALHERALALLPDLPKRRALRHRLAELWSEERWEGSACRAGALYLDLAEDECRDPALRCWPGEVAVKELRICSAQDGPMLRCTDCFPAPTPVPPGPACCIGQASSSSPTPRRCPTGTMRARAIWWPTSSAGTSDSSRRRRPFCASSFRGPCRGARGPGPGAAPGHRGAPGTRCPPRGAVNPSRLDQALQVAARLVCALCLFPPAALLYLPLFQLAEGRFESWFQDSGWLVLMLFGVVAGLLGLRPGRLGPALRRNVLASPLFVAPLALLFPWYAGPDNMGIGIGGQGFFRDWLTKHPNLGPSNYEVLCGVLCLLGAAYLPCLFAILWLRRKRRGWLLTVSGLGLLCWAPVVYRLDLMLVASSLSPLTPGALWAGPLLRATAAVLMTGLALGVLRRRTRPSAACRMAGPATEKNAAPVPCADAAGTAQEAKGLDRFASKSVSCYQGE